MLGLKLFSKPSVNTLDASFLWDAEKVAEHTPDISLLQEHQYQNIFVVDDFKRGFDHHWMLKTGMAAGHGTAFTKQPFQFYRKDLLCHTVGVPMLFREGDKESVLPWIAQPSPIKGEVYSLTPNAFLQLDKHKLNGVQFERKRVRLVKHYHEIKRLEWLTGNSKFSIGALSRAELDLKLPENANVIIGERMVCEFHAWMYVARDAYWAEQMDSPAFHGFTPVQQFIPRDPDIGFKRYSTLTRDAAVPSQHQF
jgi:hypothetical protein